MKNDFPKHRKTLYLVIRRKTQPTKDSVPCEVACSAWQSYESALDSCNASEQVFIDKGVEGFEFYVAACVYYNE